MTEMDIDQIGDIYIPLDMDIQIRNGINTRCHVGNRDTDDSVAE